MEQRLTEMEMLIMHHERTIEQLHEVVAQQQGRIDRLSAELRFIKEQLKGMVFSQNRTPDEEEPPPHY